MMLTLLICALLAALALFWEHQRAHRFWSSRSVPGPRPLPLFGNLLELFTADRPTINRQWAKAYGPMVGYYLGTKPVLLLNDPKLIKRVLISDFPLVPNRPQLNAYHQLWNSNLLFAEGEDWRRLRSISSPAFTSGKLKTMQPLMARCIDSLVKHFDSVIETKGGIIENTKEVISGFSIDVINLSCFATETYANDNSGAENSVVKNAKEMFNLSALQSIAVFSLPKSVLQLAGIKTCFNKLSFQFFVDLTREIVCQRKSNPKYVRNDLVQLLIDARAEETGEPPSNSSPSASKRLTESEIMAQCILFFVSGFETTALTLFHAIYELSQNPDIQEKLHQSLVEAMSETDDETSGEYFDIVVNHHLYLDAVIKEILRKYPPLHLHHRRVQNDGYSLAGVSLPKDLIIEIDSFSVHYNPEWFPEPERFNPGRFLQTNQPSIPYLPFGIGPRACLGSRFALQELKLCLARLIRRYSFAPTRGTTRKLSFAKVVPLLGTATTPIKILCRS